MWFEAAGSRLRSFYVLARWPASHAPQSTFFVTILKRGRRPTLQTTARQHLQSARKANSANTCGFSRVGITAIPAKVKSSFERRIGHTAAFSEPEIGRASCRERV